MAKHLKNQKKKIGKEQEKPNAIDSKRKRHTETTTQQQLQNQTTWNDLKHAIYEQSKE